MFTHIYVSRSPHYAVHNLTGYSPGRASPDARRTPPRTVWLSARVPYITAVCRRPKSHGDCVLPVLITLQRLPYRPCVSHREPRHTDRPRRSALSGGVDDCLDALAHAIAGRLTQSGSAYLWLVPHPLELCHTRSDAPGQTRHCGVGGNRATLAARDRLGVETGQAGGPKMTTRTGSSGWPAFGFMS